MVSFKFLAGAIVLAHSIAAIDPKDDPVKVKAARDYISVYTTNPGSLVTVAKPAAKVKRAMKDPYAGIDCVTEAPTLARRTTPRCSRNNCYRAFLNARNGPGRHCPIEGIAVCCAWNAASAETKYVLIAAGIVPGAIPWTANCVEGTAAETIARLDDVCDCTARHQVTVDETSDYYLLRGYWFDDPICRKAPKA